MLSFCYQTALKTIPICHFSGSRAEKNGERINFLYSHSSEVVVSKLLSPPYGKDKGFVFMFHKRKSRYFRLFRIVRRKFGAILGSTSIWMMQRYNEKTMKESGRDFTLCAVKKQSLWKEPAQYILQVLSFADLGFQYSCT